MKPGAVKSVVLWLRPRGRSKGFVPRGFVPSSPEEKNIKIRDLVCGNLRSLSDFGDGSFDRSNPDTDCQRHATTGMNQQKGPWTPEEDRLLVSYIKKHGHDNWRALPKQAGLLRCGKSCRLRWTNYLRPDIKRGNFTKEEDETIIKLHEILGNKWSAIASKLPGRTDNEIKNVWHTYLKKRVKPNQIVQASRPKCRANATKSDFETKPIELELDCPSRGPVSPSQSFSEASTPYTNWFNKASETSSVDVKEEAMVSSCEFEDSLWLDASFAEYDPFRNDSSASFSLSSGNEDDGIYFLLRVFMEAEDFDELSEI